VNRYPHLQCAYSAASNHLQESSRSDHPVFSSCRRKIRAFLFCSTVYRLHLLPVFSQNFLASFLSAAFSRNGSRRMHGENHFFALSGRI
jgi:hypothetical protein